MKTLRILRLEKLAIMRESPLMLKNLFTNVGYITELDIELCYYLHNELDEARCFGDGIKCLTHLESFSLKLNQTVKPWFLAHLLDTLSNVTSLTHFKLGFDGNVIVKKRLENVHNGLIRLFSSTSLRSVTLFSIQLLPPVLASLRSCKSLERLELALVYDYYSEVSLFLQSFNVFPRSLDISCNFQWNALQDIDQPPCYYFTGLESFTCDLGFNPLVQRILNGLIECTTLRSLSVHLLNSEDGFLKLGKLISTTNTLEHLELQHYANDISVLIKPLVTNNSIKTLKLNRVTRQFDHFLAEIINSNTVIENIYLNLGYERISVAKLLKLSIDRIVISDAAENFPLRITINRRSNNRRKPIVEVIGRKWDAILIEQIFEKSMHTDRNEFTLNVEGLSKKSLARFQNIIRKVG
ncbi:hypothetical protein HK098_004806 [Nowakowskiella sp. JEL0407]|nr:hypothetical protein HK098_004806 [Nowakowskiella sp. JEL0407]